MPSYPNANPVIRQMQGGVFSRLADRIAAIDGERFPLHVGDTYLEPAVGARMQDLSVSSHPGLHRYGPPRGLPSLLSALASRRDVDPARVQVSAGATGALAAVAGATLSPGDEVLILAPYWPLIPGVVRTVGAVPVPVPFHLGASGSVAERIAPYITDRTVALYVNTPNNPTGQVCDADTLSAVAALCRDRNLWIWSDEVYEDFAWARSHTPMAPFAPERTFTAYSFSKAYGMAGNRCGYVVGPTDPAVMALLRKVAMHSFYACSTASQLAALKVLACGGAWLADANDRYREVGAAAARRLGLARPDGGTFLFIDVSPHLGDGELHEFLVRCVDRGLILAPGSSCGPMFGDHVRLCFTSAHPDVVMRGVDVLAELMGR